MFVTQQDILKLPQTSKSTLNVEHLFDYKILWTTSNKKYNVSSGSKKSLFLIKFKVFGE